MRSEVLRRRNRVADIAEVVWPNIGAGYRKDPGDVAYTYRTAILIDQYYFPSDWGCGRG